MSQSSRRGASSTGALARLFLGAHRALFRATGGRLGGSTFGIPTLLLTTTGRKTGQPRTWPLGYIADGDRLVVIGSIGGAPKHPAWYLNLRDNPRVTVEVGSDRRPMVAETATGAERQRLWNEFVRRYPRYGDYQKKTSREIPVVILRPGA
ncbi:MAG TPA: nitroreductase family deazaflavin-dependent oxidoreductase [Chloroflexota bacterium]|jgi:deazaflavin-dependent oxidoreductase (nitroreductase family)